MNEVFRSSFVETHSKIIMTNFSFPTWYSNKILKYMLLSIVYLISVSLTFAQVSLVSTYSQNFNSLGTGSTMPTGWSHIGSLGGSNSSWGTSIPASGSPSAASTGTVNNSLIVATNTFTGKSNTRAYNYSGSTTTDRAIGTSPTTGAGNILQLNLLNASGTAIQSLQISYDIRRFANASAAETVLGYRLFISLNNGTSWTALAQFNPTSTTLPNTVGTSNFNQTFTLPSAVSNGSIIRLRWVDDNSTASSPDQRIGLDNVSISIPQTGNCAAPSALSAASITNTSATLSWGSIATAASYTLQWKPSTSTVFNTVSNITSNAYLLSSLQAGTSYDFQVQTVCSTGNSIYSSPISFTTTGGSLVNEVIYLLSGALQPTSATVSAKLTTASTTCRAVFSTSSSFSNPIYSNFGTANSANNFMAKMNISGLAPNTQYFYAVESNGVLDASSEDVGKIKTPNSGAFSFTFAHGSCSVTGNHGVYTAIKNKNPLFFLETGDFHYQDPNSSNISAHRTPYENIILSQGPTASLLKSTALAYTWDDHDYCGNNNSGSGNIGTVNARQAYQEYIPHYPLVAGSGNVPIYQAFTIGRVRFILSDLRSMRTSSSMMGTVQKDWFKQECINARNNCQMIAWVTGTSFGGTQSDNWGGFSAERIELSNFFRDNNIQNMFMMSGDAHMVAIDNGTNHDFSTGSNNPNDYPVFAAAALNNSGSNKGGTYSQGVFTNPNSSTGQYGLVEIVDNGGPSITINFKAYRTNGNSSAESQLVTYSFNRTICASGGRISEPTSLTLRSLEEGKQTQIIWNLSDNSKTHSLVKIDSEGNKEVLISKLENEGLFKDEHPISGNNVYSIIDNENTEVISRNIFMKGNSDLSVYPNPADDLINISLPGCRDLNVANIQIIDLNGKFVLNQMVTFTAPNASVSIDVHALSPGNYILNFQSKGLNINRSIRID